MNPLRELKQLLTGEAIEAERSLKWLKLARLHCAAPLRRLAAERPFVDARSFAHNRCS
jgi:hypothetical protein